jgi:hypothetical protein
MMLRELDIGGDPHADKQLTTLAVLPMLESLDVSGCEHLNGTFLDCLNPAMLKGLSMRRCPSLSASTLNRLKRFPALEKVDLADFNPAGGDVSVDGLCALSNVREILLSCCQWLTDEHLTRILELDSLEVLSVVSCSGLSKPVLASANELKRPVVRTDLPKVTVGKIAKSPDRRSD